MNNKMFDAIYDYYKLHYKGIEKQEIYKWEAIVHFKDNWYVEAEDFPGMLKKSLGKTYNLMSSGNYYPRKMIEWSAEKNPEKVRELFRMLYDLSLDLKERILAFRAGIEDIIEEHKEGKVSKSYQDDRAIMAYLNLRYPEKYYLYKYTMFVKFANLIDYAELPKAGDIELLFLFDSMCEMVLKRVKQDDELLKKYEPRRQKYYDPEYHMLVQDIIYSATYFEAPELLDDNKEISIKEFSLKPKLSEIVLKGSHTDHIEVAKGNKVVGDAGEEFVYQCERKKVKAYKLPKGKDVRWVSKVDGDGVGYDILSYDETGQEIYIEVKTTKHSESSTMYITSNELAKSELEPERYYLYRVYNFDMETMSGDISIRKGSLKPLCVSAQSYKVQFE